MSLNFCLISELRHHVILVAQSSRTRVDLSATRESEAMVRVYGRGPISQTRVTPGAEENNLEKCRSVPR